MESVCIILITIWLGIASYACLYLWYVSTKIVDYINDQDEERQYLSEEDEMELHHISVNYYNKDGDPFMKTKIFYSYRDFAKWLEEVQDQRIIIKYISIKEG